MIGTAALVAGAGLDGAGTFPLAGPAALLTGAVVSAAGFTANAGPAELSGGAVVAATGFSTPISGTAELSAGAVIAAESTSISGTAALSAGAVLSGANNGAQLDAGAIFAGTGTAGAVGTGTGRWLYLHTKPPAQVYATDAVRDRLAPGLPIHRARFEVSATAAQIGARNDSFGLRLSGIGLALRERLAAQAPYGVRVDVMDGGSISRSGIVSDVGNTADGDIDLDCESQGWTTELPLRTNADLGTFRDIERLPWRFGRAVPGRCIRLGATGKLWLWADHASSRISSVQIDDQDYGAWLWRNDIDANGNPITVITTADEIDEGAQLVAIGDGMLDHLNGNLITNPADMVYELCRRAGVDADRGDLVPFRAECQQRSLEISGSIEGGTLQQAMVTLADSIYAAFARELTGYMRLLPRTGASVTIPARDTPTAKAARDAIATRLRVRYALDGSNPRASLEVRAAGVEALRGIVSAEVTLPLVRDGRVALDVANRMLADRSRPAYIIPAARQRTRIAPGEVVNASVPSLGLSGEALVTSSQITDTGLTPALLLRVGTAPAITLAAQSVAYDPAQYAGATVVTTGDTRQMTVTGPDGRPIAGAQCTLNGSTTRVSDGAGRVSFPIWLMPAGAHTIRVVAAGMEPIEIEVIV